MSEKKPEYAESSSKTAEERRRDPREPSRVLPSVNAWTGILSVILSATALTLTAFVVVAGIIGISSLRDMQSFQKEVDAIRKVGAELQQMQESIEADQSTITTSIARASQEAQDLQHLVDWIRDDIDGSESHAEATLEDISSRADELRSTLLNLDGRLEELEGTADELGRRIRGMQEEAEE